VPQDLFGTRMPSTTRPHGHLRQEITGILHCAAGIVGFPHFSPNIPEPVKTGITNIRRLRIFEKNEAQAATIRETVQASWEQIRPLVDLLIAKQGEVAKILEQITPLQHQIASVAREHMNLVGEELDPPVLRLPKEIQYFSTSSSCSLFVHGGSSRSRKRKRQQPRRQAGTRGTGEANQGSC
jgi:hypothetical protein